MLNTVILTCNNAIVSPQLVTTREYGRWFEELFGTYPAMQEVYLKSKTSDGRTVLENHPGTRIGAFFDKTKLYDSELACWYIPKESDVMDRLKKYNLAELRDATSVQDNKQMLRVYTVKQIEYYIKATLDRNFDISRYVNTSRKISVKDSELNAIVKPKTVAKKNKLF